MNHIVGIAEKPGAVLRDGLPSPPTGSNGQWTSSSWPCRINRMTDVAARYLEVSIMDINHHPRAAIDDEQGARGLVASSMSSALRQNDLRVLCLGYPASHSGGIHWKRRHISSFSNSADSETHRTDITCKEQSSQRDNKGERRKLLEQRTNESQWYLLFGSNSAVT